MEAIEPLAHDRPPGPAPVAPIAVIYDRIRDRLRGRPRT